MTNAAKIFIPPGFLACHSGGRNPDDFSGGMDFQYLPSIRMGIDPTGFIENHLVMAGWRFADHRSNDIFLSHPLKSTEQKS